jgi:hypothetical protein
MTPYFVVVMYMREGQFRCRGYVWADSPDESSDCAALPGTSFDTLRTQSNALNVGMLLSHIHSNERTIREKANLPFPFRKRLRVFPLQT